MKTSAPGLALPVALIGCGLALAAVGIYIGDTDDAPGAALLGLVLMIGLVTWGVRSVRRGRRDRAAKRQR